MKAMISESLDSSDREQLRSLLREFSAIFDNDGCPFRVAQSVRHSIASYNFPLDGQI